MAAAPDLSVIVCSFNGADRLRRFFPLLGVACSDAECATELVVVDDGSTDDTAAVVSAIAPGCRVIGLPTNRGLSAARNAGVAASRADWILFCDDDVSVSAATLAELWKRRQPRQCLVPVVRGTEGEVQNSVTLEWHLGDPKFRFHSTPVSQSLAYPVGSCFMVRREDYQRAGGCDERIVPMYYDDASLGARLTRTGTITTMAGDIDVRHFQHGGDPSPARLSVIESAVYQNRWVYALTELRGAKRLVAVTLGLPRVAVESVRKRTLSPMVGYGRAIRRLPELVKVHQ